MDYYRQCLCALILVASAFGQQSASKTITLTVHGDYVDTSWTASTTPAVTYNVYRSVSSGGGYTLIASNLSDTAYRDIIGAPGTFFYVFTAVDASGNESDFSPEASATLN